LREHRKGHESPFTLGLSLYLQGLGFAHLVDPVVGQPGFPVTMAAKTSEAIDWGLGLGGLV
jgi:hypothetical protein